MIIDYTVIFNNAINNMYFPTIWKIAKVIAILKKDKDKNAPASYRPICLLPCISKVYEFKINQQITKFCYSNNNLLTNYQFGFRHQHSTIHAINNLVTDVMDALRNNRCVGACLIDLEKAFDSVWIEGLIYKLAKKKISKPYSQNYCKHDN